MLSVRVSGVTIDVGRNVISFYIAQYKTCSEHILELVYYTRNATLSCSAKPKEHVDISAHPIS